MTSQQQPRRRDTAVNLAKSDSDVAQLLGPNQNKNLL